MIEPITVTEQMMYSTARVVGINGDGKAFKTDRILYHFPPTIGDNRNVPILVTNKHVIDSVTFADFIIHTNIVGGRKPDRQSICAFTTCGLGVSSRSEG